MEAELPRSLRGTERSLLTALLARADITARLPVDLDALEVADVCQCGCSSIELAPSGSNLRPESYGYQLADAYGVTPDGKAIGLILWGTTDGLTYLELYSLASDPPFEIPFPDTITDTPPWPAPAE